MVSRRGCATPDRACRRYVAVGNRYDTNRASAGAGDEPNCVRFSRSPGRGRQGSVHFSRPRCRQQRLYRLRRPAWQDRHRNHGRNALKVATAGGKAADEGRGVGNRCASGCTGPERRPRHKPAGEHRTGGAWPRRCSAVVDAGLPRLCQLASYLKVTSNSPWTVAASALLEVASNPADACLQLVAGFSRMPLFLFPLTLYDVSRRVGKAMTDPV